MIGVKDIEINFSDKINNEINKKIQIFVDKMTEDKQSVNYYSKNRNVSANKAIEDIFLGKKAEYFVSTALNKYFNIPYKEPDLEIRKGRKKGWNVDIELKSLGFPNFHVKSCSAKTVKYCKDFSWTFQYSNNKDNRGKDQLFNGQTDDLICLIYLNNHLDDKAEIKAILPWDKIESKLKHPLKPTLIGLKKCIYYKDLIDG